VFSLRLLGCDDASGSAKEGWSFQGGCGDAGGGGGYAPSGDCGKRLIEAGRED